MRELRSPGFVRRALSNECPYRDRLYFGFVADQLQHGTRFRALTVVDVYTRESVAIEAGQRLKGEDVVRVLSRLKQRKRLVMAV